MIKRETSINSVFKNALLGFADSAVGARHLCRFNSRMFWRVRTAIALATLMRPEGRAPATGDSNFGMRVNPKSWLQAKLLRLGQPRSIGSVCRDFIRVDLCSFVV